MDLIEIYQSFKSEKDCHDYLINLRWPNGIECVYCKSEEVYRRSYGNGLKCRCCNKSFTVTVNTIFHATKLPLSKWFFVIAQILAAKKGISSLQLSRTVKVNKNTAWYMQMRIRSAMRSDVILRGIVEIDETYVGGALNNMSERQKDKRNPFRTGMVHKTPVLGMTERDSGLIILNVLKHADGKNIKPIIKKKVSSDSEIVTDGFGAYYGLGDHFKKHVKLNHEKKKRSEGTYNLSRIEGYFSMLKRAVIGQYHKLSNHHLQSYVDEIAFKKNYNNISAFDLLLTKACAVF